MDWPWLNTHPSFKTKTLQLTQIQIQKVIKTQIQKDKNTDLEKDKNTDLKQELGLIKEMISYDELPKKDKVD